MSLIVNLRIFVLFCLTLSTIDASNFMDIDKPEEKDVGLSQSRTFGHKRLQFMMMPMVYKMGVMMTLMLVLTAISLKGLMIGVILLILKLSAVFGKIYASVQTQNHGYHGFLPGPPPPPQAVHLHVHSNGAIPSGSGGHHQNLPYNAWESAPGPPNDDSFYYKG